MGARVGVLARGHSWVGKAPTSQKRHSGPSGPKCPEKYPTGCPRKWGCPRECPTGCLRGRAPECRKGVPRVSPECQDTFLTLSGHLFDTPEPGARRAPETPRRTLPRTPPFSGTTCRTLSGTLRARRARMPLLAGRGFPNSWGQISLLPALFSWSMFGKAAQFRQKVCSSKRPPKLEPRKCSSKRGVRESCM